jgi:hypothetical protein
MSNQNVPPPDDAAWSESETLESGWPDPGRLIPPHVPADRRGVPSGERDVQQDNTRRRVALTIAALVATVGAVVGGVVLTGGNGGKPSTNVAGAHPNAAVDPPSSGASGGGGSPTALPTLSVPPTPTPDQAQAMASAQAEEKAFAPPTSVPANVPGYTGSAALDAISLPSFLSVSVPSVQAKDSSAQALADQSTLLLKAWVEAWASGNSDDPRYRTLCVAQCKAVLDATVTLWKNANIVPAGTLRFFNLAGGLAKSDAQSGEVGVCLDDSALTAFRSGTTYQNPYPLGQPELLVLGLVYDRDVGHWVASEAYTSPGDSYCAQDTGSGS